MPMFAKNVGKDDFGKFYWIREGKGADCIVANPIFDYLWIDTQHDLRNEFRPPYPPPI